MLRVCQYAYRESSIVSLHAKHGFLRHKDTEYDQACFTCSSASALSVGKLGQRLTPAWLLRAVRLLYELAQDDDTVSGLS